MKFELWAKIVSKMGCRLFLQKTGDQGWGEYQIYEYEYL